MAAKTKKQLQIAGTETKAIKEVDSAAEAFVEARDERMALTEREVEAREALIAVMNKHKLDVYLDDDATPPLLVTLIQGEDKVKISKVSEGDEDLAPGQGHDVSLQIVPCTVRDAMSFVMQHHRHPSRSERRPLGGRRGGRDRDRRRRDRGATRRPDAHYAACRRAALALGWRRLVTYTLPEEGGASLRAAGWRVVAERTGGARGLGNRDPEWTGTRCSRRSGWRSLDHAPGQGAHAMTRHCACGRTSIDEDGSGTSGIWMNYAATHTHARCEIEDWRSPWWRFWTWLGVLCDAVAGRGRRTAKMTTVVAPPDKEDSK